MSRALSGGPQGPARRPLPLVSDGKDALPKRASDSPVEMIIARTGGSLTHEQLVDAIGERATKLGLLWHYCPNSRRCDGSRGFPDLILAGPNGVIFAEVKTATGDTSPDQDLWIWTLARGGHACRLWRPEDLDDGLVDEDLRHIA